MTDPFVVIGGDAAGLSAASKAKREDPDREVIVFEKGRWVSYAHCGMPYYVKGEVEDLLSMTSLSPEEIGERGIDLRREHEVSSIDPDARTVTVEGPDGTFEQSYGDCLVATGARALSAPFDGLSLDGAFTLHHMDAAAAIRAYLRAPGTVDPLSVGGGYVDTDLVARYADAQPPESVAIVGGGYVGVEMAEAFSAYDCTVHLFQRGDHLLPAFGEAVADAVADHLAEQGVRLHTGSPVEAIRGRGGWVSAIDYGTGDGGTGAGHESGGGTIDADLALVGVGIRPNVELLSGTDVELGDSGAIRVDDYGRTTCEGVYAAGDCAEMRHAVTGDFEWVPLGLTANRAGRAVGQTVAGDLTPVGDIAGTAVVKAFDLECGRSGITDHERAREAGFSPVSETITAGSRSGYYPGAKPTTVTLCADAESGRLLGGTIVGEDRAAVRIDTVATALETDTTVPEVERLDLKYAPPFSPVWDPILVAAKVLNGTLSE